MQGGLAAGAGLTLGVWLPRTGIADSPRGSPGIAGTGAEGGFEPNAFVRIGSDDSVTVIVKHVEMGQGTYTGLPTVVAEELDADWSQVRVEGAPADASRYNNLLWGPMQGTGGDKTTGRAIFTQDVRLPQVAHACSVFRARRSRCWRMWAASAGVRARAIARSKATRASSARPS
jgi:isoquinoline 1-oxidoreductase beta subunit